MLSTYGGNLYAEVITGRQGPLAAWYLALLTAVPGPDDSGTAIAAIEPSGASYSRIMIGTGTGLWAAASGGYCQYTDAIVYTPTEDWGTLVAYALCTANTAGYMVFYDSLRAPLTVKAGSAVTIPVNSLGLGVIV